MTHEPLERDTELAAQLGGLADGPLRTPADWSELRRAVGARAASDLARRRTRRRMRLALPASVAAGIALFVVVSRSPSPQRAPSAGDAVSAITIEELLDANVSDVQFRALVAGAADADELLLIAAGDER